jgi:urocanate hydratase
VLAGAVSLNIECQQSASTSACARATSTSRRATSTMRFALIKQHTDAKEAVSVALLGNAADILPELVKRAKAGGSSPTS